MNKNLIKSYVLRLDPNKVKEFALKEGVSISDYEANLFVSTAINNVDYVLDGHGLEVLESIKEKLSPEAYNKLLELFNTYKKFID